MAASQKLHVVIIGAGLGGLSAAIAITRAGHRVTVLEQATTLRGVGAGVQLPPNATRILARWGLLPALARRAVHASAFVLRSYRDGAVLSRAPLSTVEPPASGTTAGPAVAGDGAPYLFVHRADYQRVLLSDATRCGARVLLGHRAKDVDLETPSVSTSDGTRITADIVVGADGLHSTIRAQVLGEASAPPCVTGDAAYRIAIPAQRLQAEDNARLRALMDDAACDIWIGPGAHAVGYPVRAGQALNMVLCGPDDPKQRAHRASSAIAAVRQAFAEWDPVLQTLLAQVPPGADVEKWRLMDTGPLKTWIGKGGRVMLMGDACHATLPYLAQGAALAVEDGAVLGVLMGRCEKRHEVSHMTRLFERMRKERGEKIVERSRRLRDSVHHLPDGLAQRARDKLLLEDRQREGSINPWKDPVFAEWLFGYDVEREVEAALKGFHGEADQHDGKRRSSKTF